ncbi:MAG TPA: YciI family protein, partial [Edaphobacter sp.]|nr:YciI family protein [Edaphobacter sp.]
MRFLMLYRPADTASVEAGIPPTPEMMARMGDLIQRKIEQGKLLSTEGCAETSKGAKVRLSRGKVSVTDGPFAEAKELVAGFALFRVSSKQEAIEEAREFLDIAGDGEVEIRLIHDTDNCLESIKLSHQVQGA